MPCGLCVLQLSQTWTPRVNWVHTTVHHGTSSGTSSFQLPGHPVWKSCTAMPDRVCKPCAEVTDPRLGDFGDTSRRLCHVGHFCPINPFTLVKASTLKCFYFYPAWNRCIISTTCLYVLKLPLWPKYDHKGSSKRKSINNTVSQYVSASSQSY